MHASYMNFNFFILFLTLHKWPIGESEQQFRQLLVTFTKADQPLVKN